MFNEHWYRALDLVLVTAREAGVRLLLPVVHADYMPMWGGVPYIARWAQASGGGAGAKDTSARFNDTEAKWAMSFYTDEGTKRIYRAVVRHLVGGSLTTGTQSTSSLLILLRAFV